MPGACASTLFLEFHADLDAKNPRLVDHRRQIIEVDARYRALVVGDVPDETGDVVAVGAVADPQAALDLTVVAELDRPVEEELDLRAVIPIGVGVDVARADREFVAGGPIHRPLRRLRQLIAVNRENPRASRPLRVEHRTGRGTAR